MQLHRNRILQQTMHKKRYKKPIPNHTANRGTRHASYFRCTCASLFLRFFSVLAALLFLTCVIFFGAIGIICLGPSAAARDLFVNTLTQTSAAGFLAHIYLSDDEIEAITEQNNIGTSQAVTNTSAVRIVKETADSAATASSDSANGITVTDVAGASYHGKLMCVDDPARVSFYTIDTFSTSATGKQLSEMISETGSAAGMNAGGFYDPDGRGHGAMPLGAVIKNGVLISNYESEYKTLIGFDASHKLIIGNMSPADAISMGMQNGITFGPALVINGQRVPYPDNAGGLNPRSAIGQKSNGAILLLVIDGRQPGSLGASFKDLCDIMLQYGAVNAANLDGGSSSILYYQGQQLNHSASLIGLRPIPSAILVRP
ncbi:MAG: phosphodiester glycosidase family protein [Butyrivibrio sp.]|nr:phosphodiester glycosidase family protein [Butyrivibrio sp.]